MEGTEKNQLTDRTLARNNSLWVSMDWGGLLTPIADEQAALNTLGAAAIENYMAISDDAWEIKEYQRNKEDEFEHAEIAQGYRLTDDKAATERQKLAIKTATDNYVLAVRVYDAKVRSLLMGAKEFAALVEREQLEIEVRRAALAVEKEQLRQYKISAEIYEEQLKRAMVEVEIARAQVDVAKAHVRAVLADIAAGEAEIKLLEAEVQRYVALADKATLQADVASIYAEIITKGLAVIKLDVGRKEIQAGFTYIQSKLDDMLAIWDARVLLETIKASLEADIQSEVAQRHAADKKEQDLKEQDVDNSRIAFDFEVTETNQNISQEANLREGLVSAKKTMSDKQREKNEMILAKKTWAQILENTARKWAYKHGLQSQVIVRSTSERISGG